MTPGDMRHHLGIIGLMAPFCFLIGYGLVELVLHVGGNG